MKKVQGYFSGSSFRSFGVEGSKSLGAFEGFSADLLVERYDVLHPNLTLPEKTLRDATKVLQLRCNREAQSFKSKSKS